MFLKSTKWTALLSLLLLIYLAVVLPISASSEHKSHYPGYRLEIDDPSGSAFITGRDLSERFKLDTLIKNTTIGELNLAKLNAELLTMPEIEDARVSVANNGILVIEVQPMKPVARVFDPKGSYYVNAAGKMVKADMRYHVDVPLVVSELPADSACSALVLLPMLKYVASKPELNALVSDISLDRKGNMIIQPVIRGHVVVFGDTADMADKFNRLMAFYRQVSAVKGWDYYDTISVKWRGQVVAKRNMNKFAPPPVPEEETIFDFIDDDATMEGELNDSVLQGTKKI